MPCSSPLSLDSAIATRADAGQNAGPGAPPKHLKMRTYSDQLGVAVGEQVDAQSMALRFDA